MGEDEAWEGLGLRELVDVVDCVDDMDTMDTMDAWLFVATGVEK